MDERFDLESHRRRLIDVAEWYVPRDMAEDIVQEAFLKAWRSRETFRRGSSLFTWLYSIVRNAALDYLRARPLEMQLCVMIESEEIEDTAEDMACRIVGLQQLRGLIAELPETWRRAISMKAEGLSQEEIADRMGCALGTAKSRIARGQEELRRRMARAEGPRAGGTHLDCARRGGG